MHLTRRAFLPAATITVLAPRLLLAQPSHPAGPSPHPDVAAIDHDRILTAAQRYLAEPPVPITALPSKRNPGSTQDFFSEADDWLPNPDDPAAPYTHNNRDLNPEAFTAHQQALINLSLYVPALTAAHILTRTTQPELAKQYAGHAIAHLRAWFIHPSTRMNPTLLFGQLIPGPPSTKPRPSRFEGILEAIQLVEVAQSIPFLEAELTAEDRTTLHAWFASYLEWLTTSRLAGLARDQKDHHGSSWLLQCAAFTRLTTGDDSLTSLRHHFRSVTLRAQILADGSFPHELATPNPYRNSLFNLDLLAAICDLLSTRFDSVWTYELQDGPGMRSVIARHYPFMLHRNAWPYLADASRFTELPLRQPSLLLAARAYSQPDYSDLWKKLPADPTDPILLRTFPIRQPLLWVTRSHV